MKKDSKIYVAGHTGLVGSAITGTLRTKGYGNLLLRTMEQVDLTDQKLADAFFAEEKPEYVFIAAAKVDRGEQHLEGRFHLCEQDDPE
jgi:GDP-L-fucose synthase